MSDLDITIALDPGPAATSARKVTEEVKKTEEAGKQAEKAFDNLTGSFARMGKAIAEEMRRADAALSNIGGTFKRIADHERAMQSIANQRVSSLGEALSRVAKYQAQIDKQAADAQRTAMSVVSLPAPQAVSGGFGSQLMDQVKGGLSAGNIASGVVGGLVGGGLGGLAVDTITALVGSWREHEKAVADAERSLRKYFDSASQTADVVERQDAVAKQLNISLRDQVAAFSSVREASEGLFLTTLEQTKATQTLNEIMLLNNKDVSNTAALMEQLQLAMNTGGVTAGQLTTIMKQFPDVAQLWAAALDTDTKGLLKLARDGGLGRDAMEKLFATLTDGTETHKKYDDAFRPWVEEMKPAADAMDELNDQVEQMTGGLFRLTPAMNENAASAATLADMWEKAQMNLRKLRYEQGLADSRAVTGGLDAIIDLSGQAWDRANRLFNDPWGDSALQRGLKAIGAGAKHAAGEFASLHGILVKITEEQRNMAVARSPGIQSATGGIAIPQASGVPAPSGVDGDMERMRQGAAVARQEWEKTLEAAQKAFEAANNLNTLLRDQLIGSAGTFASIIVDSATAADASWKGFFSSIGDGLLSLADQLAKTITQALILQALTGSVTGAKGPGGYGGLFRVFGLATGGDLMVTSSGLRRLPAAATGADWMVGGRGGTDSQLVAFRASPNETVHVRTPEQRRAAASASGGGAVVHNNYHIDPRALLAVNNTKEGQQSIVNTIAINAPLVRRLLGI